MTDSFNGSHEYNVPEEKITWFRSLIQVLTEVKVEDLLQVLLQE